MEVRHTVLTRLATHYEFAAAQRLCLSYLWKKSEANPLQLCLMSVDKMDQMKSIFPRFAAMQQADFMKTATRLRVGIVGCYIPGVYREPINCCNNIRRPGARIQYDLKLASSEPDAGEACLG